MYKCASCDKEKSLSNMVLRLWEKTPTKTVKFGICRICNNLMNKNSLLEAKDISQI